MEGNEKPTPDLSGILNLITQNPALLSGIASMLGSHGQGKPPISACEPPPPAPPCESGGVRPPCKYGREIALLEALKPFLDRRRCQTIDMLIQLSGVFELFKGR